MSGNEIDQDGQDPSEDAAPDFNNEGDDAGDSAFVVTQEKEPLSKGSVAMFVLLTVAGAGAYFMYARSGTQSATAAVDLKAQQVIKQFMTERAKNPDAMKQMLRDTEEKVRWFRNYPGDNQRPLTANPFRMTPLADAGTPVAPDNERDKKLREEERIAVLKDVNALQLQSVMHSDARKSCMINNSLYLEGQQVESFTIEKISPNAVIVRHGSYRFELRMQR
jgi:hypothetical protein